MLLALALVAAVPAFAQDTAHLVIVATTDVHGGVLGWDDVHDREAPGGLTRAATIIETLRAQYPGQVVVVDAGDALQGSPFAAYFARENPRRPNPIVDAFNALQYDAATPGNHDFDFGMPLLRAVGEDAAYRYVSANITTEESDSLLFAPFTIVTRAGVRVGITGFTTPGVMVWDRDQVRGQARVGPVSAAAPAVLRQMAGAGVDFTVVLAHAGLDGASSYDTTGVGPENDAAALALQDLRPDLVIVGHSHREMRDSVIRGVHFVQPQPRAQGLAVVHVWFARAGGRWNVASMRSDLIPLATVAELPRLVRRVAGPHDLVRAWASQALATAGAGFQARYGRAQDTPLMDFINEVQRRRAGADLSAAADFDVAGGLPDGEVHLGDVAGIYPYENTLVAVRISGAQLKDYLEHSARYYRTYEAGRRIVDDAVPGYNFDVVAGASYRLDLSRPPGARVLGLAVGGRPVAPGDSFTLALNSYRAAGGGGYDMVRGARRTYDRGESVRDLLIEELKRLGTLDSAAWFTPSWSLEPAAARAAAIAAFAPPAPVMSEADSTLLRVVAITDFHGALEPRSWGWSNGRPVGGAAVLKAWFDTLTAACACATIRLDGGDEMQGTPESNFTYGRATIAALNAMGIDVAAIGNHDFDWTVDTLRARIHDARYQFVSANITDSAGTARPDWAEPWTVVSRGGVKVAVIGLTTTSTPTATRPQNVRGLAFADPVQAVRAVLPAARAAANFVIVLAHEGAGCDSTTCTGPLLDLARGLDSGSVDLIVGGHWHRLVNTTVNGIPVMEASSSGGAIAVVDFVRAGSRGREVRARLVTPWADSVTPDPALSVAVARARRESDSIVGRPVAALRVGLRREGDEHALGRLIADAYRNMAKTDVGFINSTGIRADLAGGTVTYGDLFQVSPFQNRLVVLTLTGAALRQILEFALSGATPLLQVSGLRVTYDPGRPAGERIRKLQLLGGRPVDPRRSYTLAVPDFLADGGSGFAQLRSLPRTATEYVDLDALITYLHILPQPVSAPQDPRLQMERRR